MNARRYAPVIALVAAAALAQPAVAQSSGAEAAALEVMRIIKFDATVDNEIRQSIALARSAQILSRQVDANPALRAQRAKNPKAWDAALARVGAKEAGAVETTFAELKPLYRQRVIAAYVNTFSADELKQLAQFYRSPVGAKLIAQMPPAMMQANMWMQQEKARRLGARMQALKPDIDREIAPLMPKPGGK